MVGSKRVLYRCTYLYYISPYIYTYIFFWGGDAAPSYPTVHIRNGLETTSSGVPSSTLHVCLTCRHPITACTPPVLLLISATRAEVLPGPLPTFHPAASLQPPQPWDRRGISHRVGPEVALRLWLPPVLGPSLPSGLSLSSTGAWGGRHQNQCWDRSGEAV